VKTLTILLKRRKSKSSVVSLMPLIRFNAKFAGVTNKAPKIHCSVVASAMVQSDIFTTTVLNIGSNKK